MFTTAKDEEALTETIQWSSAETCLPDHEVVQYADVFVSEDVEGTNNHTTDEDEFGAYVELCFDPH
eukprot:10141514-Karenia_brevis.AAC.1